MLQNTFNYRVFNGPLATACINWEGYRDRRGYGQASKVGGKKELAHRRAYRLYYGPIPEGLYVCHHCDNPSCVNPDHLYAGTPKDNAMDREARGRGRPGTWQAIAARVAKDRAKTHCKRGHSLMPDSPHLRNLKDGRRMCFACWKANRVRRREESKFLTFNTPIFL